MLLSIVRRRIRATSFILAVLLAIVCTEAAFAKKIKGPGNQGIAGRLAALETVVSEQKDIIAAQQILITALQNDLTDAKEDIEAIEPRRSDAEILSVMSEAGYVTGPHTAESPLIPYLTVDDENNIYITGANLHIRSGSGATNGNVNGLGNLIVGYNESNDDIKTGSHNLVIGKYHSYSSYGGFVAGYDNQISGIFSSV
ncbi:hypothetical protein H206_03567, partial [Candidatus Electrothrix aarhusensis]